MLKDSYETLARAIQSAGFYTNGLEDRGSWQRTTVCSKRTSNGRLTGNSFWVTQLASGWHFGVWNGTIYKLADGSRIDELCIEWLGREPDKTLDDFNDLTKQKFGLVPVSEREFDQQTSQTGPDTND
jgi:hypothetical protein